MFCERRAPRHPSTPTLPLYLAESLAEDEYSNWNHPDLQLHANRALLSKLERPQEVRDFASQWLEENWGRAARWLGVRE